MLGWQRSPFVPRVQASSRPTTKTATGWSTCRRVRVAVTVIAGALILGIVLTVVMLLINESVAIAAIMGGFAALIGATVGAIVGAARLAGQRANSQPQAPGRTITVVATFLDDDLSREHAGAIGRPCC